MKAFKQYKPYIVLIALLAITSLALMFTINVNVEDEAAVNLQLPGTIRDWRGHDMFFCQNELCMRGFIADELANTNKCPVCGGELKKTWSLAEVRLLPADTVLEKKQYVLPSGEQVMVSVVVSGEQVEHRHRP